MLMWCQNSKFHVSHSLYPLKSVCKYINVGPDVVSFHICGHCIKYNVSKRKCHIQYSPKTMEFHTARIKAINSIRWHHSFTYSNHLCIHMCLYQAATNEQKCFTPFEPCFHSQYRRQQCRAWRRESIGGKNKINWSNCLTSPQESSCQDWHKCSCQKSSVQSLTVCNALCTLPDHVRIHKEATDITNTVRYQKSHFSLSWDILSNPQ